MFITCWLVTNTIADSSCSGDKTSANRWSKASARQHADTRSVPSRQSVRRDSWTEYTRTIAQEKHLNFNMNFIEARIQDDSVWPGILPNIVEEEDSIRCV